MIVRMRKATILFQTQDAGSAVQALRRLGVMHIEHQNLSVGVTVTSLQEKVALIESSLGVLNQLTTEGIRLPPQEAVGTGWEVIADRIIELGKQRGELDSQSRGIIGQIHEWEPWGDIDPERVQILANEGIYLALYQVPTKEIDRFPDDVVVKTVFRTGEFSHCVTISRRAFECPFIRVALPAQSLSSLKSRLSHITESITAINDELLALARFHDSLASTRKELGKEIEFQQVLSGMGKEGPVSYITGYIPFDREEELVAEARKARWGIMVTDPSEIDIVPTLIRNPQWAGMIRPVLGLLGLTPGYRELDVSIPFLVFFSIFFGILIGDAGYGLAYIVITLVLQKVVLKDMAKDNPEMKTTFSLFYLLGCCAVVWGLLTGTFFGQAWFLEMGYIPPVPELNDPVFIQTFCFFLGALHLSLAHSWRAALKFPSLTLFSDVGWICVLWTAFFLARTLILGEAFPAFAIWLILSGIVLVILFTHPQRNVLKGIGTGLATVALSLMSNITDVISYIRLFAVGLATLAIAETTNILASGFGDGMLAVLAAGVILITGHGLNIILGPMSVLVHGVRLNVLEFSGHANVTWSGTAFEPLREE